MGKSHNHLWLVTLFSFLLYLSLLCFHDLVSIGQYFITPATSYDHFEEDSCSGRYVYVHDDLPSRFNLEILNNCQSLIKWFNMCPFIQNSGLGPQVKNLSYSWFSTNQFSLELIFHERMKKYKCLTNDSSLASAVYVPFYAGLDIGRYLWDYNTSIRDASASEFVRWISEKPEWKRMLGRDHFFVAGRIAWDFRRQSDDNDESNWGSKLMFLPESMNMTMLSIESTSWSNEFAIPYPTYFHPSTEDEILQWQTMLRTRKRNYLFSFAGAPRNSMNQSIRGEIINQCLASMKSCKLLDCSSLDHEYKNKCDNPVEVIKVFEDSVFCLQPPGDSYTRRSTFDSILAGCIPVFFHPGSAYAQYIWYLPKNFSKYSVFIHHKGSTGNVSIHEVLLRVSDEEVAAMREEVIRLIPKIVYADPRKSSSITVVQDAFDIAINGVLERVENVRKRIKQGKDPSIDFAQGNSWKSKLSGIMEPREVDQFF